MQLFIKSMHYVNRRIVSVAVYTMRNVYHVGAKFDASSFRQATIKPAVNMTQHIIDDIFATLLKTTNYVLMEERGGGL